MRYNRGKSPLLIIFNKLSPNHRSNPFFFFFFFSNRKSYLKRSWMKLINSKIIEQNS